MCAPTCPCMQFTPPEGERCRCGLYLKAEGCPYCMVPVGGVTAKSPREQSKAELLEAWDKRVQAAAAANPAVNPPRQLPEANGAPLARAGGGTSASASPDIAASTRTVAPNGETPTTQSSTAPRPKGRRPKTQRRTSEQVRRAAQRQMAEREALARRASPEWLREGMDDEEQFVASLKRDAEER